MDHNGNSLRIKIKIRSTNAAPKVDDNDCKNQFSSTETPMEKGLLFQPSTPVTAAATRRTSPSPIFGVVDCSKFLHSWLLTGRRGRKSTFSPTSSTTTTDTVVNVIPSDRLNKKRVKTETHSDYEESSTIGKVHVKENKNNGALEKEYKCNMCRKVFTNPKALGGHKSGHNKANKTDAAIKKETASATIGTSFEPKPTMSMADSSTDPTDWKRPVLDFDLNKLPPEEASLESCFLHL
ncbi:hypothetical protein Csa_011357 [Cucumis sativus]|uniref:C2H2-type domain-containing protein n=1 Tax=Cucumis sativus TaxID=3659 RepID=A0A0A0L1Z9_CUCSA|nr:hypothetical protein Csa_011357 [Cucumis sativus]